MPSYAQHFSLVRYQLDAAIDFCYYTIAEVIEAIDWDVFLYACLATLSKSVL
jgi:hypothetical protein